MPKSPRTKERPEQFKLASPARMKAGKLIRKAEGSDSEDTVAATIVGTAIWTQVEDDEEKEDDVVGDQLTSAQPVALEVDTTAERGEDDAMEGSEEVETTDAALGEERTEQGSATDRLGGAVASEVTRDATTVITTPTQENQSGVQGSIATAAETDEYEDEGKLEREHTDAEWRALEARLATTDMMVTFSLDTPSVCVPGKGYVDIADLAGSILKVLGGKGVRFGCEGLTAIGGADPVLIGRPTRLDRQLWTTMRRGYVKVLGVLVWMQPAFTGKNNSNLDLTELEYSNANYVSVDDLYAVLASWGAVDALVVSHGGKSVRHRKWPAVECVTTAWRLPQSGEMQYSFRLFFDCTDTANKVYAAYLAAGRDDTASVRHAGTIKLKPVRNADWDPTRRKMYRPTDADERQHISKRLHLFGITPELTVRTIESKLHAMGYAGVTLATQKGRKSGTLMFRSEADAERMMMAYGRDKYSRLYIGNVKLSVNTPAPDGSFRCFMCNQGGHFTRECKRNEATQKQPRHGRASEYWQRITETNQSWDAATAPGWLVPGMQQSGTQELQVNRSMSGQATTEQMMKHLIAEQVKEQTQAMAATIRQEAERTTKALHARITAQDSAIREIQDHQATETGKTDRIEQMLTALTHQMSALAQHVISANFRGGEPRQRLGSSVRKIRYPRTLRILTVLILTASFLALCTASAAPILGAVVPREGANGGAVAVRSWSSSDDSANSEVEDRDLLQAVRDDPMQTQRQRRQKRRTWRPAAERGPVVTDDGPRAVLDEILRREHFVEQYIGDDGATPGADNIRIATANINGGIWRKLHERIKTWFVANSVDFLAISDAGLGDSGTHVVWNRSTSGGHASGLLLIGNRRAAILMDAERWESRWKRDATRMSPSGRSVSITLRLGGLTELVVLSTYCIDTPSRNRDETAMERRWIAQSVQDARRANRIVLVAGDFNCYGDEHLDRQGPERSLAAQRESARFRDWIADTQLLSTFRVRHPDTSRFTYHNGSTQSALDDILISAPHSHVLQASGVWLKTLNQSDHAGTPFVDMRVDGAARVRGRDLRGVKDIKVLRVRGKSRKDLEAFTQAMDHGLDDGTIALGNAPPEATASKATIQAWLSTSIAQLYHGMYATAKRLWGEKSQAQQQIDRAVSQKRTNRCNGQLKAARDAWRRPEATGNDIALLVRKVQWPKWIVHPVRTPASSLHADGAHQICAWRVSPCPIDRVNAVEWAEHGWRLWKKVLKSRRDWRFRQRQANRCDLREHWMATGNVRRLLRDTFGAPSPPIRLRGALVQGVAGQEYHESKEAVTQAMTDLLDSLVPPDERTQAPQHLDTNAEEDEATLPRFVRDWILHDIKAGGTRQAAFQDPHGGWQTFDYDIARQQLVDRMVSKGVAPGHGGINQELWVAAPDRIRRREREIFSVIIKTGCAPLPASTTGSSSFCRNQSHHRACGSEEGSRHGAPL